VIDAIGIPPSGLRVPLAITTSPTIVDQGIPQQAIKLLPFFPTVLTKLGPQGVLMVKLLGADATELHDDAERQYVLARNTTGHKKIGGLYVRLFAPERVLAPEEVVSVNGIGDTFCGALAVGLVGGSRVQHVIDFAQRAASLSLRSRESVSPELKALKGDVAKLRL
jgi:pseudouridine-5'-phosphate glycosidase/pseudouridine kinase